MNKNSKILIVGHDDIIERSLMEYFQHNDYKNVFSSSEIGLNTTIQTSVYDFFQKQRPEYVTLSSVRSGGIEANQKYAADFIYQNSESQNNVIYASNKFGVKKLLYIASSCVYPKECKQPMKEEYFLTGKMEPTSEPYSTAKAAGIKLCQSYRKQYGFNAIPVVPSTVYGPGCDTDLGSSHVIDALIVKFANAVKENKNEVVIWGSGDPRREFLYKEDFVSAIMFLMDKYDSEEIINIGCGYDVSIKELAEMVSKVSGFKGSIKYDETKPDGTMQKLLDSSRIQKIGWKAKTELLEGIENTFNWYKELI